MKIDIKEKNYIAKNNRIRVYFDITINSRSKNLHLALMPSSRYSVHSLSTDPYLKSGKHGFDITFYNAKAGWKFLTLQLIKITKRRTRIIYSKRFKVNILNLDTNLKRQAYHVRFLNFSPRFSNTKDPKITFDIELKAKDLSRRTKKQLHEYNAEVFLNEKSVLQLRNRTNPEISFWPQDSLVEGYNKVEVFVYLEEWPEKRYRFERRIYVELRPPELRFRQFEIFTNKPNIELEIDVVQMGVDIDWTSLNLKSGEHEISVHPPILSDWKLLKRSRSDVKKNTAKLQLVDALWQGKHYLTLTLNDVLGRKSHVAACQLFIDNSAPYIRRSSIKPGDLLGPNLTELSLEVSDLKRAPVLFKSCEIITGIGKKRAEILSSYGINTILDLLNLNPQKTKIPNIADSDLIKFIYQTKIIANIRIPAEIVQDFGIISVEGFIQNSLTDFWHGVDVKKLKEKLLELYLVFDITILRNLDLREFLSIHGTGLDDFTLSLNEDPIDAKYLEDSNTILAKLPKLEHGEKLLTVQLKDKCGNMSLDQIHFFLDAEGPRIIDRWPVNNAYINKVPASIAIKYDDEYLGINTDSVTVFLDGEDISSSCKITETGISTSLKSLSEGEHELELNVADNGENALRDKIKFTYDSIAPQASFYPKFRKFITESENLKIGGFASEKIKSFTVQDQQFIIAKEKSFEGTVHLNFGDNLIQGRVEDLAGNKTDLSEITLIRINHDSIALQGRILNNKNRPLAACKVYIATTELWTYTDENGYFSILGKNLREGKYRLFIKPATNDYLPLKLMIELRYGHVSELGAIRLIKSTINKGSFIDLAKDETTSIHASNELGDVSIFVSNGNIKFPPGSEAKIAMQLIKNEDCPVPLPENTLIRSVLSLEPSGLETVGDTDIPIRFSNPYRVKENSILPLYVYSNEIGEWKIGGFAKVKDDKEIVSLPGAGLKHFSLAALSLPTPKFEILHEDRHLPGADALKGGLHFSIDLLSFLVSGEDVSPKLHYNSLAARPHCKISGVFKGLETITEIEKLEPYTVEDEETMRIVNLHQEIAIKKPWYNRIFSADDYKRHDSNYQTIFVPLDYPVNSLEKYEYLQNGNVRNIQKVMYNKSIQTYKLKRQISTETEQKLWPNEISSKYYLNYIETDRQRILGREEILTIDNQARTAHKLPANFSIAQFIDPKMKDGKFFPTGLYQFIADYQLKYEGFSSQTTTNEIVEFELNARFLEYLEETGNTDYLEQIQELKNQQENKALGKESIERWNGAFNALNHLDSGSVILQNETESPLGKGWTFGDVQKLYPISKSEVLCISADSRMTFTARSQKAEFRWKSSGQEPWDAIVHSKDEPDFYFLSRKNKIFKLMLSTGILTEFASLPVSTKKTVEKSLSRKYVWVNENYQDQECYDAPLPPHKWRLEGPWYDPRLITHEYQCFTVTKTRTVQKATDEWNVSSRNEREVDILIPVIDSLCMGPKNSLYFSCSNTHGIYQLSLDDGSIEKISGKEEEKTNSSELIKDNDNRVVTIVISTYFNSDFTADQSDYATASINSPKGLTLLSNGDLLFCEYGHHRIRKLSIATGKLETIAGNGSIDYHVQENHALKTGFPFPNSIAIDRSDNIYCLLHYTEKNAHLVKIDRNGMQHFISGASEGTTSVHVEAWLHKLVHATDIAVNSEGIIYVFENKRIISIEAGEIHVFAGGGTEIESNDLQSTRDINIGHSGRISCDQKGDLSLFNTQRGALWRIGTDVFSEGPLELEGPIGYHDSKLVKTAESNWKRVYKNRLTAFFDQQGKHLKTEDLNGNCVTYSYNAENQLIEISYPFGQFIKLEYDERGKLISIVDHSNRKISTKISNDNLLEELTFPDGKILEMLYDDEGRIIKRIEK